MDNRISKVLVRTHWEHPEGYPVGRLVIYDSNIHGILRGKSHRARKHKLQFHYKDDDAYGYSLPEGAICWIPMRVRQWERLWDWLVKQSPWKEQEAVMPRKGYVKNKPKNLVKISGESLHFVALNANSNGHRRIGETPTSRELRMLMDTFERLFSGLKYHYLAIDLNVVGIGRVI